MTSVIPALTILALLLPCDQASPALGQSTYSCQQLQTQEIERLVSIVRNQGLMQTDVQKVINAVDRLGELKAASAVDDLANLLTLDRGAKYFDTENPPSGGIITPYSIYPAVKALANIGEKSVPALVRIVKSEEASSLATRNATEALRAIFRDNPSRGYEILLEAAKVSETDSERAKLLKVAELLRIR